MLVWQTMLTWLFGVSEKDQLAHFSMCALIFEANGFSHLGPDLPADFLS